MPDHLLPLLPDHCPSLIPAPIILDCCLSFLLGLMDRHPMYLFCLRLGLSMVPQYLSGTVHILVIHEIIFGHGQLVFIPGSSVAAVLVAEVSLLP